MTNVLQQLWPCSTLNRSRRVFQGLSPPEPAGRVFGGQVLAQALMAATRTVEGRLCHSLHAYFLARAIPGRPSSIRWTVRATAPAFRLAGWWLQQGQKAIFTMAASFQRPEEGFSTRRRCRWCRRPRLWKTTRKCCCATRTVAGGPCLGGARAGLRDPFGDRAGPVRRRWGPGRRGRRWITSGCGRAGPCPTIRCIHRALLAFMSDMSLLDTALAAAWQEPVLARCRWPAWTMPCGFTAISASMTGCSTPRSRPAPRGGRGYRGSHVYTRDGKLMASVAQEGVIRPRLASDNLRADSSEKAR